MTMYIGFVCSEFQKLQCLCELGGTKAHKCRKGHVFWAVLRLEGAGFEVKSLLILFVVSFLFEYFCQFSIGPLVINFRSLFAIFAGELCHQMLNSLPS